MPLQVEQNKYETSEVAASGTFRVTALNAEMRKHKNAVPAGY